MTDSNGFASRGYNWPEITAVIFSLLAIAISGFSLLEGRWQHRDERNTEILDAVYEDWETLALRDDWRVQHLGESPKTYYAVRDLARISTAGFTDKEKAEALLVERATANLIFTNFEHHLKQWMLAVEEEDDSRQEVLKEEIDFYAQVQLRNPRMLWYWSEQGGGWINSADPSTVVWYRQRVLEDPDHPLDTELDAEGILPGFEWSASTGD